MFRKVIGDPPVPMIAFAFTIIGLINLILCWPIPLGLYLSGTEVMPLESLFWIDLLIACILMLSTFFPNFLHQQLNNDFVSISTAFHILTQFSSAVTYNMFVTLGLITSVPVSAGKLFQSECLSIKTNSHTFFSFRHCFIWSEFCWHEIGWSNSNCHWVLFSYVSLFLLCPYKNPDACAAILQPRQGSKC